MINNTFRIKNNKLSNIFIKILLKKYKYKYNINLHNTFITYIDEVNYYRIDFYEDNCSITGFDLCIKESELLILNAKIIKKILKSLHLLKKKNEQNTFKKY